MSAELIPDPLMELGFGIQNMDGSIVFPTICLRDEHVPLIECRDWIVHSRILGIVFIKRMNLFVCKLLIR